ncbi:glucosamine-6-phosphate deaminase [Aeromicrobium sp. Root236]|uniref:glucosamine-6-phosphate deaminase n=1 Tax=Aeromicrobium sp. Root236 TaxID=1736498 RepID=UPI0006F25F97|nr:glucosamine-6-phosphate deaminase [Aeromicrobium sp. Root236]KRC64235.1 glucosamine-6-phosphate deaminase [Aeromicrobium sp. Root236]
MEVVIVADQEAAGTLVADIVASHVRPGAVLGLATGSSPLPVYRELIRRRAEGVLSLAECRAFLLDEYVGLPRQHPESYHSVIRREFTDEAGLDRVDGPDGEARDIPAEAARYEAAITAAGGVDVQLLGIGTDGHLGFNEPGSSLASRTRVKTLTHQTRVDNARFFDSIDDVPRHVITQGLGTILDAGHLVLIATGAGKAAAVTSAVEGPVSAFCPASILQLHPRATVVVDEAAAATLQLADYYREAWDNKPDWQRF